MKDIIFIFGTRPEAIKLAPVVRAFKASKQFNVKVCVTAQHREMLDQVMDFFDISADYDLDLMESDQSLFDVTASVMRELEDVLDDFKPDLLFVQGDTTTAFVASLAGFYKKIRIAHVEAGLRSGNMYSPFPEEMNRILTGRLSDYHFAPTERAADNLLKEGIRDHIWVVGNSVIDSLFLGLEIIKEHGYETIRDDYGYLDTNKRTILVTGHRRESFGEPFEDICNALKTIVNKFDDVQIVYPVHLNPNIRDAAFSIMKDNELIHLVEPLDYPHLIWLMNEAYFIITDSGGIQEEAPSLGKPVLVTRDVTERVEGIDAGTARLVGTKHDVIVSSASELLTDHESYNRMARSINPYGDGKTSERILIKIKELYDG